MFHWEEIGLAPVMQEPGLVAWTLKKIIITDSFLNSLTVAHLYKKVNELYLYSFERALRPGSQTRIFSPIFALIIGMAPKIMLTDTPAMCGVFKVLWSA